MALNEAGKQPAMNLSLARVYLKHSDPSVFSRPGSLRVPGLFCLARRGLTAPPEA